MIIDVWVWVEKVKVDVDEALLSAYFLVGIFQVDFLSTYDIAAVTVVAILVRF